MYTDKTTGGLRGISVSTLPIQNGVSFPQYLDWIFQGGSDWSISDFEMVEYPGSSQSYTHGGDAYFNQQSAIYPSSVDWPVIDTITRYETTEGYCLGFALRYVNYPGRTFQYYKNINAADSTKTLTWTVPGTQSINQIDGSADSVNGSYIAIRFNDGSTNVTCGNFDDSTDTAIQTGSGSPAPVGFNTGFDATNHALTTIAVYDNDYTGETLQAMLLNHLLS